MSFLQLENLSKRYGPVRALDAVGFSVAAGSRTVVVGPSGSGKSTLMRLVAGFEAPDQGRIVLRGRVLADDAALVPAHKRGIGIVAQDGALFPHLTVADNIGFGLERRQAGRRERILELLDLVELDRAMASRRPHQLSGGQQQRVALARALAPAPGLILLDEPFSALDTGLRQAMRRSVARILAEAGIATILVTHDQTEALSFADQLAVLREGRLVQIGPPRALYAAPGDQATAAFLGDALVLPAEIEGAVARCDLGNVAVETGRAAGPASILLRPEQITLIPIPAAETAPGICYGEVVETEFAGGVCTVVVALAGRNGSPLSIRRHGAGLPSVGQRVRIDLCGQAHVFD